MSENGNDVSVGGAPQLSEAPPSTGGSNVKENGGKDNKGAASKGKKKYNFDDDDFVPEVGPDGTLKRMERPDSDAKDAKVKELTEKIDSLIEARNKIDKEQQIARAGNKPFNEKRRALVTQLKEVRAKRKVLMDAAQECKERVDKIMNKEKQIRANEKKVKDQLKYSSVEDVDAKIKQLEERHERTALSKDEEKVVMKEISTLRQTRRKVAEFIQEKNASVGNITEDIPTLRAEAKAKRAEADGYKDAIEKLSAELDKLTADNQANANKANKLQNKRKEIQKQLNDLFAERDQVKKDFAKVWSRFKKFLDALNKQRAAERKAHEEQLKKEREEYERKLEEEEMAKKPWEAEIALCDMLISYLQNIMNPASTSTKKTSVVESNGPAERQGGTNEAFSGLQAVGKKSTEQEDFLVMGGSKKKTSAPKKKKSTGKLSHAMDLLSSFIMLDLVAPAKMEDIPASIEALKDKRAYYDVLPRAEKKKKSDVSTSDATKKDQAESSEKKTNKKKAGKAPSVENSELFPVLPGSKSPQMLAISPSGPSAVDVVKSSGAASPSENDTANIE